MVVGDHLKCNNSKAVSSNPAHVIKLVSDFRQVGGCLRILWFLPPIKLTAAT